MKFQVVYVFLVKSTPISGTYNPNTLVQSVLYHLDFSEKIILNWLSICCVVFWALVTLAEHTYLRHKKKKKKKKMWIWWQFFWILYTHITHIADSVSKNKDTFLVFLISDVFLLLCSAFDSVHPAMVSHSPLCSPMWPIVHVPTKQINRTHPFMFCPKFSWFELFFWGGVPIWSLIWTSIGSFDFRLISYLNKSEQQQKAKGPGFVCVRPVLVWFQKRLSPSKVNIRGQLRGPIQPTTHRPVTRAKFISKTFCAQLRMQIVFSQKPSSGFRNESLFSFLLFCFVLGALRGTIQFLIFENFSTVFRWGWSLG